MAGSLQRLQRGTWRCLPPSAKPEEQHREPPLPWHVVGPSLTGQLNRGGRRGTWPRQCEGTSVGAVAAVLRTAARATECAKATVSLPLKCGQTPSRCVMSLCQAQWLRPSSAWTFHNEPDQHSVPVCICLSPAIRTGGLEPVPQAPRQAAGEVPRCRCSFSALPLHVVGAVSSWQYFPPNLFLLA